MKVLVTAVTTLPSYTQPRRAGVRAATRKTLAWGLWKLRTGTFMHPLQRGGWGYSRSSEVDDTKEGLGQVEMRFMLNQPVIFLLSDTWLQSD